MVGKIFIHLPGSALTNLIDWNPITKEAAFSGTLPIMAIYAASKKHAELAVWEWADAHPHVDVTLSVYLPLLQH
jgi:nucleoside-diphosphate-sugar epimerase